MQSLSSSTISEPDKGRVKGGNEPQQHVDKINPHSILHSDLTVLVWSWVGWDVDGAEKTEESDP